MTAHKEIRSPDELASLFQLPEELRKMKQVEVIILPADGKKPSRMSEEELSEKIFGEDRELLEKLAR